MSLTDRDGFVVDIIVIILLGGLSMTHVTTMAQPNKLCVIALSPTMGLSFQGFGDKAHIWDLEFTAQTRSDQFFHQLQVHQ